VKSEDIVEVKIRKKEVGLVVWMVPLIALIVGGWMIYKYYSELGPMIEITFKNSGGLEPKQSYIKFRDVKVGVVERVKILKKSEGVVVYARMNKDVEPFLNETTRFWIVKPEIGVGKVRGLDALVSGSYIQMFAKIGKESRNEFTGLDEPPLNLSEEPGSTFELVADRSYGLSAGSPVYYRQIQVGKVEKVLLPADGKQIHIYIFVKRPYDRIVNTTSRFWNVSYADLSLSEEGLSIQMHPISQLLLGGIAFETKETDLNASGVGAFYLYPSKQLAQRKRIGVGQERFMEFLMRFDRDTGYLDIGAPVKIEGYTIGHVEDIISSFDPKRKRIDSYVIAKIDLASFRQSLRDDGFKNLKMLVAHGLKARLEESIPFLHRLYVNLVFTDTNASLVQMGDYYRFPTVGVERSEIARSITKILQKLQKMPIERTLDALSKLLEETREPIRSSLLALRRSLEGVDRLLQSSDTKDLPKALLQTLSELNATLKSYEALAKSYGEDSLFKDRINELLKDLDRATKQANKLFKKLDRKPNAIIFGE